jgi:hypothetical protein
MTDSSITLGPWVRLEGISISQLPTGAKGNRPANEASDAKSIDGSGSATAPDIKAFVTSILSESIPFIDGVAPKSGGASTWKGNGSPKRYASSEAPVHLYERVVPGKELDKIDGMSQVCQNFPILNVRLGVAHLESAPSRCAFYICRGSS